MIERGVGAVTMEIAEFKLERFFARWEFAVPYNLGASDVEPYRLHEVLDLADEAGQRLWADLALGYTESNGHPTLRSEIASLYQSLGPDDVLASLAPTEAIFAFTQAVLRAGDHAIVVWPTYQALYEVARALKADVSLLPLRAETGWALDSKELRALVRPTTRAIVINFPHNPTGAMIDVRTFEAVVSTAAEARAWLFSDEMFRFLEFDPAERLPAAADVYERGVSLGGMSKSFAMGGLRIGWLATRDRELLARVARIRDYGSVCGSAPSEILATIALRARHRVLSRSREVVLRNLERLDRFFADWSDTFSWVRPRGGSVAFPMLRVDVSIDEFARDLAEREGVLIVPGTVFEHDGRHFRVGLGRRILPEALERLEHFLMAQFRSSGAHPQGA